MSSRIEQARSTLKKTFGYDSFRSGQEDIISNVLDGRDVLGVMPTGGGKSLCFQIPALMFPACTLVVSPLVALMTDQVERLKSLGVPAEALHSGLSSGQLNNIIFDAHNGRLKLLYVAPERLESTTFRQQMSTVSLSLLAVDEAHCISEWGHEFRPAYRNITRLFESRPRVPIAAFTATATPDVRADIAKSLELNDHVEIVRGFDRPNLSFRVEETPHKTEWISQQAKKSPDDHMIVYAGSRRRVDTIAEELVKRSVTATSYHAGKPPHQRDQVQQQFIGNKAQVLVATNAFGMGIDKADVRHVVHADLTLTLEAYYQEAGRAGRDGNEAVCTLLYQSTDRRLMDFFIEATYPDKKEISQVLDHLFDRARVGVGGIPEQAIHADKETIAVELHMPVAKVGGVLSVLERYGIIVLTSAGGIANVRLRSTGARFKEFTENAKPMLKPALEAIGRVLQVGPSQGATPLNVSAMLRKHGLTPGEFGAAIRSLQAAHIVQYSAPESGGGIEVLVARPERGSIPFDLSELSERRSHAKRKLDVVIRYAETTQCKRNFILNYFGDGEVTGECGKCSSCLEKTSATGATKAPYDKELIATIIRTVHELGGRFGKHVVADVITGSVSERVVQYSMMKLGQWASGRERHREEVMSGIDSAVERGWIVVASGQYPTLSVLSGWCESGWSTFATSRAAQSRTVSRGR